MKNKLTFKILNRNNTIQLTDIQQFIEEEDSSFKPNISTKVHIPTYTKKLYSQAIIIACLIENKIVGLSAFYCQPTNYDYSFLSYIAVNAEYRSNGIAKKLISTMIDYCKEHKTKGIKTSTWEGNKAITLYHSFGFITIKGNNDKRVELILKF